MKVKRYEEAEKVKMKADLLEEFERNKLEAEVRISLTYLKFRCKQSFRRESKSCGMHNSCNLLPYLNESSVIETNNLSIDNKTPND